MRFGCAAREGGKMRGEKSLSDHTGVLRTYIDRPDFFAAMGESDDELERMLAVLRWTCESRASLHMGAS